MALAECGIKLFGVFPAMPVRQLKHLQVALATIPVSVVIITTMNTPTEVKPAKATVAEKGISEITHVIMSRESISAHDIIRKNRKRPLDRGSPDGNAVVGEQPDHGAVQRVFGVYKNLSRYSRRYGGFITYNIKF